jgi:hypothetical protein
MEPNKPAPYNQRILELVQKWRTETIEGLEYQELSAWFYALEEKELGPPIEITVELVEKRVHEQLRANKNNAPESMNNAPTHPWHDKRTDTKI